MSGMHEVQKCNEMKLPLIGIDRLRFATDGEGIRALIATYGCSLKCKYCLNPQSIMGDYSPICLTAEEILARVEIDNLYFQATHGGITIGGGEPLIHIEKLKHVIDLCPRSWSKWVETSLNVDSDKVVLAATLFDHFIVDIKTLDQEVYYKYTGGRGDIAYKNLEILLELVGTEKVTVRVPLIPGYTSEELQTNSVNLLKKMGIVNIDTFTYSTNVKKLMKINHGDKAYDSN